MIKTTTLMMNRCSESQQDITTSFWRLPFVERVYL